MSDAVIETTQADNSADVNEADLQRMLDAARGHTAAAEARALAAEAALNSVETERDQATSRVVSEAEQRYTAEKRAVDSQRAAAKADAERAEAEYVRAHEAGDAASMAKAQRAIAAAAAREDRLTAQHEFLESNKDRFVPKAVQQQPRQQPPTDPYARLGIQLVGGEREWLEKRPKFLADEKYRGQVYGASQLAENRGYTRGSQEYFDYMEKVLDEDPAPARQPAERRPPSSDLAPTRRSSPGADPSGGKSIRLTADQVEAADGMFGNPGNAEFYEADPAKRYAKYAGYVQRMRDAGRMQ